MLKSLILINVMVVTSIAMAESSSDNPKANDLLAGLTPLEEGPTLKNSSHEKDLIVFENKYFKVYHPNCYETQQFIPDEDANLYDTPFIKFSKTNRCPKNDNDLKDFGIYYHRSMTKDPKALEDFTKNKFLHKKYIINGNEASIVGYISDTYGGEKGHGVTVVLWKFQIYCPKAKYNYIEAQAESLRGKEVSDYFKKKDFKVPPNFEKIVSAIQCK